MKSLNEQTIKRLQKLAGINEIKIKSPTSYVQIFKKFEEDTKNNALPSIIRSYMFDWIDHLDFYYGNNYIITDNAYNNEGWNVNYNDILLDIEDEGGEGLLGDNSKAIEYIENFKKLAGRTMISRFGTISQFLAQTNWVPKHIGPTFNFKFKFRENGVTIYHPTMLIKSEEGVDILPFVFDEKGNQINYSDVVG
jgi:hypothetical protein